MVRLGSFIWSPPLEVLTIQIEYDPVGGGGGDS